MGVRQIARISFGGMLSGSRTWITFLILLNSTMGSVSVVKAGPAVFTSNSGVSRISIIFLILGCDGLSMLITLGMPVIKETFIASSTVCNIWLTGINMFLCNVQTFSGCEIVLMV